MADKKITRKQKPARKAERGSGPIGSVAPAVQLSLKLEILIVLFALLAAICFLYPELVFQNKIFFARDVEAATSFARAAHRVMIDREYYHLENMMNFESIPTPTGFKLSVLPVKWVNSTASPVGGSIKK